MRLFSVPLLLATLCFPLGSLAAPPLPKACEVGSAKEIVFNDATPGSQSYVQWQDGKRSGLDGYSAQCKGSVLSERGKVTVAGREISSLGGKACSFSFDNGRCLCESPSAGGKFACRSTGLKKITEALQKAEEASSTKKASR